MALKFEAYAEALTTADIRVGQDIWFASGEHNENDITHYRVVSAPHPYKENAEYDESIPDLKDHIVFDTVRVNDETGRTDSMSQPQFAKDCNADPSTHTDDYIFDTPAKAAAYLEWKAAKYAADPVLADDKAFHSRRLYEEEHGNGSFFDMETLFGI